jgi:hypothetical protein
MAITNARIQVRRGLEKNFNPDEMTPGEWALSTDTKYIRMCIYPGLCLRMATYEAFEEDMKQIQSIVSEARTIQEAINRINTEVSSNAQAVAEYTVQAKQYRDEAKQFRDEASALANVGIATETVPGLMAGGDNAVSEDGTLMLTKVTTDRTLLKSHAGGLKVNSIDGESVQDGTPSPDNDIPIKSVEISEIKGVGKNLLNNTRTSYEYDGLTITRLDNGGVRLNGTANTENITILLNDGVYLPKGKYKLFSGHNSEAYNKFYIFNLNGSPEWVYAQPYGREIEVTVDSTVKANMYIEKGTSYNNVEFYPMICSADVTDSTYEPYTEKSNHLSKPIILRRIGDVKDMLYKQDGVYGILRKFAKKILNGSETYSLLSAGNNSTKKYFGCWSLGEKAYYPVDSHTFLGYCSHLIPTNYFTMYWDAPVNRIALMSNAFFISLDGVTTVDALKTKLSANNIEFMYELETPVFEPLPIADQIVLHQLETFDEVTHIFTDSEIEPVMEVEYGTSKVGAYAIKGMNTAEANALQIAQLNTLTNELATQLVAGSEV